MPKSLNVQKPSSVQKPSKPSQKPQAKQEAVKKSPKQTATTPKQTATRNKRSTAVHKKPMYTVSLVGKALKVFNGPVTEQDGFLSLDSVGRLLPKTEVVSFSDNNVLYSENAILSSTEATVSYRGSLLILEDTEGKVTTIGQLS